MIKEGVNKIVHHPLEYMPLAIATRTLVLVFGKGHS
jgi:hypothetical protein